MDSVNTEGAKNRPVCVYALAASTACHQQDVTRAGYNRRHGVIWAASVLMPAMMVREYVGRPRRGRRAFLKVVWHGVIGGSVSINCDGG